MSDPLTPPLHLLTKILSLGDLAKIFMKRKLFQADPGHFPHLRLLMHDPLTPPPLLLNKMLSLGHLTMISMERKSAKAISDSLHPLPDAIISPKVKNWLFPRLCTPMGNHMSFFFIFSDRKRWVKYSFTPFMQEIGIFSIF